MKITIDRRPEGFTVEVDRPPLPEGRFKAVCALAAVGVYAGLVVAVAALCGLPGLVVMGFVTLLGLVIAAGP